MLHIISIILTKYNPTEVGAIVTVIMMGDVLGHTTVTGGVVVIAETTDIVRNTLQRKNIYYINFIWLNTGIPL